MQYKDSNKELRPWASKMISTGEELQARAAMDLGIWVGKTEDSLLSMFIHELQLELLRFHRIHYYYFVEGDLELAKAIKAEGVTIEKCYKHAKLTELRGYYKGVLTAVQTVNFETERVM